MRNDLILKRINTALKAISVGDLGESKLVAEQADQFIKVVSDSTPILNEARLYTMDTPERKIDRTGFGQRILHDPDNLSSVKPSFDTNTLEVVKAKGKVGIEDDTLEDNIQREDFEDLLIEMIAERCGVDLDELFIQGDSDDAGLDDYLQLLDGWLKKADHKLDSGDYDVTDVEDMFDKMLRALDQKFLRNRADWRFYTHWDIEDDYRNALRARGTALGDMAQTEHDAVRYKGIPVYPVANMPEGRALLANPDNVVYGIRRDIRIEPDRKPEDELTNFIVTLRADCHYENEEASVASEDYTG